MLHNRDTTPLPARRLPQLRKLKEKLAKKGKEHFTSVFMTGSGSTIVCIGDDTPPAFLFDKKHEGLFIAPARLIMRRPGQWYSHPNRGTSKEEAAMEEAVGA